MRTEALYAAQDLLAFLLLLALVPAALVQWLLFHRTKTNYAETYAFNAFVHGHLVWLAILLSLLPASLQIPGSIGSAVAITYLLWATCGFYRSRHVSVMLHGLVAYGAFYVSMLAIMQATIVWWLGR